MLEIERHDHGGAVHGDPAVVRRAVDAHEATVDVAAPRHVRFAPSSPRRMQRREHRDLAADGYVDDLVYFPTSSGVAAEADRGAMEEHAVSERQPRRAAAAGRASVSIAGGRVGKRDAAGALFQQGEQAVAAAEHDERRRAAAPDTPVADELAGQDRSSKHKAGAKLPVHKLRN